MKKAILYYNDETTIIEIPQFVVDLSNETDRLINSDDDSEFIEKYNTLCQWFIEKSIEVLDIEDDIHTEYLNLPSTKDIFDEFNIPQDDYFLFVNVFSINDEIIKFDVSENEDVLSLFWCKDDCGESWFVISTNDSLAHDFHRNHEGLDTMIRSQYFDDLERIAWEDEGDIYEPSSDIDDYADYIEVTEVAKLPKDFLADDDELNSENVVARHAQIEDLEKLGFKIIDDGSISNQRMVKYNGEIYKEGTLVMMLNITREQM